MCVVWSGVILEDDVFVGPNCTFCNDKFPRSGQHLEKYAETRVQRGASLGANSTILPGIVVGEYAMVGAGSVVTHHVTAKSVAVGNPARHLRHVDVEHKIVGDEEGTTSVQPKVRGARLLKFPAVKDRRGTLSFAEYETHLPWVPVRFFTITEVPQKELRGYHAHKSVKQLLVCVTGKLEVLIDDGNQRESVVLQNSNEGLLLDAMVWSSQSYLVPGTVLLVLCSEKHSPEGYIHSYADFVALVKQEQARGVQVPFLNVKAAALLQETDMRRAFERVLQSGQYVGGAEVEGFEREWAHYCEASECAGVGSGLAALHLALVALDIGPGHEVIVPANTYIATLLAVSMAGAKCVLVEPDPKTRLIDPTKVSAAITPHTKAILSCDLYGTPVDYDALAEIARKHGLRFVSDAAQSHGAVYKGKKVGSDGLCDATCFSFYPSKNLGALGEAGAVVTGNAALAERVRTLRNYGSKERYQNDEKGFNERFDPLQAAFLRAKLPHLDQLSSKRQAIAQRYHQALNGLDWLSLPPLVQECTPSYHLFVVACDDRDGLQSHLQSQGVATVVHYPIPPHLSKAYRDLPYGPGSLPITEKLASSVLSIPVCPFLEDHQIEHVIGAIKSFKN